MEGRHERTRIYSAAKRHKRRKIILPRIARMTPICFRVGTHRRGVRSPNFQPSTLNFSRILLTQDSGCRARAHSQIRTTRHPALRKVRFTTWSRFLLPDSLRRQNARLFAGFVACLGQPCQKQPSTKSASRICLKTKSGRTLNFRFPLSAFRISKCLRQPLMPCRRNNFASASSVSRLPRERIRDMTSERFRFEKTSAMTTRP